MIRICSTNLNESIYLHSYYKYMDSFKHQHLVYWAKQHKRAAESLGKENLIH